MIRWLRALTHRLLKDPQPYAPERADPVDVHAETIPQTIDCSALGEGDLAVLRANWYPDLTNADRDELDLQFSDALTLLDGPTPKVPGPYTKE